MAQSSVSSGSIHLPTQLALSQEAADAHIQNSAFALLVEDHEYDTDRQMHLYFLEDGRSVGLYTDTEGTVEIVYSAHN